MSPRAAVGQGAGACPHEVLGIVQSSIAHPLGEERDGLEKRCTCAAKIINPSRARALICRLRSRKVKKLKRQRTRSLIHGPDNGSADRPAHYWGDR